MPPVDSSAREGLPDPSVLQEYEYASEGAADRIITMARLEQEHRQRMEEDTLVFYRFSYRFGQTCGMTVAVATVAACVYLTVKGNETFATFLALTVFSAIAFSHVTAFFTVRSLLRPEEKYNRPPKKNKQQHQEKNKKKKSHSSSDKDGGTRQGGERKQRRRRHNPRHQNNNNGTGA